MIVLKPIDTTQNISFIPRTLDSTGNVDIVLRKDGYGQEETISGLAVTKSSYYCSVDVIFNILSEGETYTIELKRDGELWYRDNVYVTAKTDFSIKHKQAVENYTQKDENISNEYIIKD
jgi:hypothetical protein